MTTQTTNKHALSLLHLVNHGPYDWHYAGLVMKRAAEEIQRLHEENLKLKGEKQ